jgi:hypothetical protein
VISPWVSIAPDGTITIIRQRPRWGRGR